VKRREFITLLGGAVAWPVAARAQRSVMPVIGLLDGRSSDAMAGRLAGFRQGLKEIGFAEGENVRIVYRWAENQLDRLPELAADLVRQQPAVIFAAGGQAPALAAKAATTTIPVVFLVGEDPARLGLVSNLARPTGNLTGFNLFINELEAKRLDYCISWCPALFALPSSSTPPTCHKPMLHYGKLRRRLGPSACKPTFSRPTQRVRSSRSQQRSDRSDPMLYSWVPRPFLNVRRVQLAQLAAFHRLPATYALREAAEAGGLLSYGTSIVDAYRQSAIYVGRILKGAKPADLPVMQASKFKLVINLSTARLLALTVPPTLLALADEVIE